MADSSSVARQGGTGRKRIEIKKIVNKDNLIVTFSKRRNGLFKKASQLCLLSGSEIAIIVFSPGERPYVFGHSSPDTVIHRFLGPAHSQGEICGVNAKNHREKIEVRGGNGTCEFWWDEEFEHMELHELQRFKFALEELRTKLAEKTEETERRVFERDYLGVNSVKVIDPVVRTGRSYP
ncbi:agamous-like MADS-box protein AGL62 [Ziziphus jujuba]|uniref:Agamous-like MADS-box protein AGL62 n=2 Tax=Ziziphus jujuba TaxID=326968 RepID=A0A6P3Z2L8_ZIZJJ|nr:agamous-like MADS-box protein AGL62 [Ziziphus jujuba]